MTKQLRSTKIFIYISIFGCLLNLVANEEGNFYLTGFEGKSWKFDLEENTTNGKILADELKRKIAMPLEFRFLKDEEEEVGNKRDIYCSSDMENITFAQTTGSNFFKPYDIIVDCGEEPSSLTIFLENSIIPFDGVKIGQLKEGTNSLSEFNSTVLERFKEKGTEIDGPLDRRYYFEEPLTLGYEEIEEGRCRIGSIIAILFGGTLLAGGLYLLLSRCL